MFRKSVTTLAAALVILPMSPAMSVGSINPVEPVGMVGTAQAEMALTAGGLRDVAGAEEIIGKAAQVDAASTVLTGGQHEEWAQKAEDALRQGHATLRGTDGIQIHGPSTVVRQFDDGYMVQHELEGESVVQPSTLTVLFDEQGSLISSTQILLRDIGVDTAGRMTMWNDGKLVADYLVDDSGERQPYSTEAAASQDEVITAQWSWSKFKACLNRQGVASWVVTSISIACSVVCLATFGAGCAACIAAAGSIASTTIFYCARTSF